MKYYRFCELEQVGHGPLLTPFIWVEDSLAVAGAMVYLTDMGCMFSVSYVSPVKVEQITLDELGRVYIG